jgi:hypothetical protein
VAFDGDGNVLWLGTFEGTVDLGGQSLTSAGEYDVFVAKLDPAGAVAFTERLGGAESDNGSSIVVDEEGNVFVSGSYEGAPDLGGGLLPDTHAGAPDGGGPPPDTPQVHGQFLLQLDASGKHVRSRGVVQRQGGFSYSLVPDGAGGVLLAGSLTGRVDLWGQTPDAPGGRGFGLVRLDRAGAVVFAKAYGSTFQEYPFLAAPQGDGFVLAGGFDGEIDLDRKKLESAGGGDIFVARTDAMGNVLRRMRLGGEASERVLSAASTPDGAVAVTGYFEGALRLGTSSQKSTGNLDTFVVVIEP